MPETSYGLPYPASTDDPRVWEDMQALAAAINTLHDLPDAVSGFINSTISVTATSLATLPSPGPLAISITNPSADFDMEVDVSFSAWLTVAAAATSITVGVAGSGGMTWGAASFGAGGPIANSDNLFTNAAQFVTHHSEYPIVIPAGASAVTLTMQAFRSNTSNAANCNYPTLRAKPRRFIVP
jgi:hypothetical protein